MNSTARFGQISSTRALAKLDLAFIHIIERTTGGARELAEQPFDYVTLLKNS